MATAQLAKLGADSPLEPVPTIPIAKVHRPGARVQTRVGIGTYAIDHAAGLPLDQRASWPELVRPESTPREIDATRPAPEEDSSLSASGHWGRDETPVVLPLQRTWTFVWTAFALVLIPIVIWLLLALASKNKPSDPVEHPKGTDVVVQQPQNMSAERPIAAPETAAPTSESSTASPQRGSKVGKLAKRAGSLASARGSSLAVKKRAAAEARLKSR